MTAGDFAERVAQLAYTIVTEGSSIVDQDLNGDTARLASDLKEGDVTVVGILNLAKDEVYLASLAEHPAVRRSLVGLLRETLVSMADAIDTRDAESGE